LTTNGFGNRILKNKTLYEILKTGTERSQSHQRSKDDRNNSWVYITHPDERLMLYYPRHQTTTSRKGSLGRAKTFYSCYNCYQFSSYCSPRD